MTNRANMSVLDLQLIAVDTDKDASVRTNVANVSRRAGLGPFSHESIEICKIAD